MKKTSRKWKKATKLLVLGTFPFILVGAAFVDGQTTPSPETVLEKPKKALSKEEFAAALASKFQLMQVRANQLKAMNECFFRVSNIVLEAKKKGKEITKSEALELIKAQGLDKASTIEKPLKDLANDPYIRDRIQHLLVLDQQKDFQKIHTEFLLLEKEIRSDLDKAKSLNINVSSYKNIMSEYARSHAESLMWTSIFEKKDKTPFPLSS